MKSNTRRITMADYWSVTDETGKPLGHGIKVGNEYYGYVKDDFEVVQYVNQCVLPYIDNPVKRGFRHSLSIGCNKLRRVVCNLRSLSEAYKSDADLVWFYVPEIYLFLFLCLLGKKKKKIAINVFEDFVGSGVKKRIFKKAISKADVIFATNKYLQKHIGGSIYVPDYSYEEEKYHKYRCQDKQARAICLGSMNEKKKLREAVEVFTRNGYPLYIAGQFADKQMYEDLNKIKGNNVLIEDRYVDTDEYYSLLGSSKFCLIPYDSEFYKNRTSGVIQECLFCDSVPVSDHKILDFSGIRGVGYGDISDLGTFDFTGIDSMEYLKYFEVLRNEEYDIKHVKRKVIEALKQ